jgi:hypothetical protein
MTAAFVERRRRGWEEEHDAVTDRPPGQVYRAFLSSDVRRACGPAQDIARGNQLDDGKPWADSVTGIFTMAGGAAMVCGHNVWSGGALPVTVTLLGWLTLIKGIALMAMPPRALIAFCRALNYPAWYRPYMAVALAFSAWLTLTAFLA